MNIADSGQKIVLGLLVLINFQNVNVGTEMMGTINPCAKCLGNGIYHVVHCGLQGAHGTTSIVRGHAPGMLSSIIAYQLDLARVCE